MAVGTLVSCSKSRHASWSTPEEYYALPRWSERVNAFSKIKRAPHTCSLFIGDSITEGCDMSYFLGDSTIVNMGIGGDFSQGLLRRLEPIALLQPKKIFVLIGINDILKRLPIDEISKNHLTIIHALKEQCPTATIYFQSVMPINNDYHVVGKDGRMPTHEVNNEIKQLNQLLETHCANERIYYVHIYDALANDRGQLMHGLTYDGLHLDNNGNQVWTTLIRPLIH